MLAARREGLHLLRAACKGGGSASSSWQASASFASTSRAMQESDEKTAVKGISGPSKEAADASTSTAAMSANDPATAQAAIAATKPQAKNRRPGPMQFDIASFPSLLREPHPVLDAFERYDAPATPDAPFPSSVTFFNSPRHFKPRKPSAASIIQSGDSGGDDMDSAAYLSSMTQMSAREINGLHRHLLKIRRVVQQTGKGRFARMSAIIVTGNGKGMVGYGEGKDINAGAAARKGFHDAVKNMDFVERHDGHTIPAEVSGKWSSTKVTLRPRPPGFGLRVPPVVHAIARSAGITDMSASILGSTNPINVAKATLSLLWGGSAPQGLGDGIGGPMRRIDRGVGMRTVRDIELARGRRLRQLDS